MSSKYNISLKRKSIEFNKSTRVHTNKELEVLNQSNYNNAEKYNMVNSIVDITIIIKAEALFYQGVGLYLNPCF